MQTYRDAEIVAWIARFGAAGAEHVMSRFQMSRSMAYHRLRSLTQDGLLEHQAVLYARPGMYTATRSGLRWQGLGQLDVFQVRPGGFEHAWQVAQAAVELHQVLPGWKILSEREIRSTEIENGELLASARVGRIADRAMLHRPDIALVDPGGGVVAVEVELSIKSASRLVAICRGWARARHIEKVCYLATGGPARAVGRAVRSTNTADRITILALGEVPTLARQLLSQKQVAMLGQPELTA